MGTISISKTTDGKTITKQINEYAWNLLGKNKEGWVANTDQNITDLKKPETGEKKPEPIIAVKKDAPVIAVKAVTPTEKDKEDFNVKATELNLTKNDIKNYFDTKDVKYSNAISLDKLKIQLGELLNYNLEELTKAFK